MENLVLPVDLNLSRWTDIQSVNLSLLIVEGAHSFIWEWKNKYNEYAAKIYIYKYVAY